MTQTKPGNHAIYVGCAGWALRKEHASRFPVTGSHLARYAERLPAVEINSSFYRPHRPTTYAKWAESVPEHFRFAVKVPKEVTHERRLVDADSVLERFLPEAMSLGGKLGPLLVQIPPSLTYSAAVAERFLAALREGFDGDVVFEPRHGSWFSAAAERILTKFRVARVAADPAVVATAAVPGGWDGLSYYRLHGSPQVYYSAYSDQYLETLSMKLSDAAHTAPVWCILDNTAAGSATANALDLLSRIRTEHTPA